MSPNTHFTRDARFLDCNAKLIANVAIANVHYINKDQVQVKRNKAIATQLVLAPCKTLKIEGNVLIKTLTVTTIELCACAH